MIFSFKGVVPKFWISFKEWCVVSWLFWLNLPVSILCVCCVSVVDWRHLTKPTRENASSYLTANLAIMLNNRAAPTHRLSAGSGSCRRTFSTRIKTPTLTFNLLTNDRFSPLKPANNGFHIQQAELVLAAVLQRVAGNISFTYLLGHVCGQLAAVVVD